MPGTWYSGGDATFLSPEEALRGHDLIEWAGTQSWSNGRVGMSGVSYLTSSMWTIAATRPPHLAARARRLSRGGLHAISTGSASHLRGDGVVWG